MGHTYEGARQGREATLRLELAGSVSPRRATRTLAAVVAALVLLSAAGQLARALLPDFPGRDFLASLFNLDGEWNIPSAYSTLAILACAALLGLIARAERLNGSRSVRHWRLLSLLFVGLAFDEWFAIHEALNDRLDLGPVSRFTRFSWVVVGVAFVAVVSVAFFRFLTRLPAPTRRGFLLAGAVFVAGSLGLEAVGGHLSQEHGQSGLLYLAMAHAEEVLEMAGIILAVRTLLAHLQRVAHAVVVELRLDDQHGATRRGDRSP